MRLTQSFYSLLSVGAVAASGSTAAIHSNEDSTKTGDSALPRASKQLLRLSEVTNENEDETVLFDEGDFTHKVDNDVTPHYSDEDREDYTQVRGRDLRGVQDVYDNTYSVMKECNAILAENVPVEVMGVAINTLIAGIENRFNSSPQYDDYYSIVRTALDKTDLTYVPKNGIRAMKICASCTTLKKSIPYFARAAVQEYCGDDVHGSDAKVSGVLIFPIGADGEILPGARNGHVWMRGIQSDADDVYSNTFPTLEEITTVDEKLAELISPLISASSGFVTLIPDYLGFGESSDCFQANLAKKAYQTSTMPLWFKAKNAVSYYSSCKAELSDQTFVSGFSEGGYSTIAVSDALNDLGVKIISSLPGAPAANVAFTVDDILGKIINSSLNVFYAYVTSILGFSYAPFNPNNNVDPGFGFISQEYEPRVFKWIMGKIGLTDLGILSLAAIAQGAANQDLVNKYLALEENELLCDNPGDFQSLCDAFDDNSVRDVLDESTYPVRICHSPFDELINFENLFSPSPIVNPNVQFSPTIQQWMDETQFYNHLTSSLVCYLIQAFNIAEEEASAGRISGSGKCFFHNNAWPPQKQQPHPWP